MNIFTQHPQSIGETYFQHLRKAYFFGIRMIGAGIICFCHGLFPFLFEKTASRINLQLTEDFLKRTQINKS